ncbi:hypothetical protein [Chelativorans sp. Marseille-P2723]|uniref:hypothetical protein n=1 Tax=Chelativorans sp. Marseille-P2723 TaxID=2709133 RepID=UPI0015712B2D|nr:hypothetical protein [Chelativorans sp. Marseille-P2723]
MKLLVLAIACIWTIPAGASKLVGATVPPYPRGMTSDLASCIPLNGNICAYSIATLNREDGSVVAVLAKPLAGLDDGKPVWEIVDEHEAPEQSREQLWAFEECQIGAQSDSSVVGLVTFRDMGGWIETEETVWAVRFDIASNRLVELDPANVTCVLPGS